MVRSVERLENHETGSYGGVIIGILLFTGKGFKRGETLLHPGAGEARGRLV